MEICGTPQRVYPDRIADRDAMITLLCLIVVPPVIHIGRQAKDTALQENMQTLRTALARY
jgi:hypothetical protein